MLLFIIIPASFAPRFVNFNTSHVTVYRRHTGNDHPVSEFQYISCYCLSIRITIPFYSTKISIHLMLLFIGCSTSFRLLLHFNTSHVTVYQVEIAGKKYTWTHFNTSHVTVYQSFRTIMIRLRRHFNTSHVTVYHLTVDFNDSDIILFQYISINPLYSCHNTRPSIFSPFSF